MIIYILLFVAIIAGVVFVLFKTDGEKRSGQVNNTPRPVERPTDKSSIVGSGLYDDPAVKQARDAARDVRKYLNRERYITPDGRVYGGFYGDPTLPPPDLTAQNMSAEEAEVLNRHNGVYATEMDRQYSNPAVAVRQMHPVLAYQYMHDMAINPANIGDPIRIPDVAGPTSMYGGVSTFVDALAVNRPNAVPVPMGALKATSEKYNKDMFRFNPLAAGTIAQPLFAGRPGVGPQQEGFGMVPVAALGPGGVTPPGAPLPYQGNPISSDFLRPYGPNVPVTDVPFFGNVNAYAPFPEIVNPWEKAGLLTSESKKDQILNLYRRPIAPLQDLWEYQVQDKNGFVIKLEGTRYLENGDIVHHVIGKDGLGPWKVHVFVQNKYIWM
jgi:hypothetical protein